MKIKRKTGERDKNSPRREMITPERRFFISSLPDPPLRYLDSFQSQVCRQQKQIRTFLKGPICYKKMEKIREGEFSFLFLFSNPTLKFNITKSIEKKSNRCLRNQTFGSIIKVLMKSARCCV